MHLSYTPYIIPMLVAAVVSAALSAYVWRRRNAAPGATALALLMLALTEWLLAEVLCLVSSDLSSRLIWAKVEYIGIVSVPVLWLAFALQYIGRQGWLTRRNLVLLAICPIITLLLTWTNEAHGLIWAEFSLYQHGSAMLSAKTYGVWFWIQMVYSYALVLTGAILVVQWAILSFQLYRRQAVVMLIGALVPLAGNMPYVLHWGSVQGIDPTPLAFTVCGLMLALGLFRFRLLDIVPVARDTVINSMNDGLIVLDAQDRIVDMNPSFQGIITSSPSMVIGQPVAQILPFWTDLTEQHREATEVQSEVTFDKSEKRYYYDIRISPLYSRRGSIAGRIVMLHDITERKNMAETIQESERRYRELVENMSEGLAAIDSEGIMTFANKSICHLLGYELAEMLGKHVFSFFDSENVKVLKQELTKRPNGIPSQYEISWMAKSGRKIPAFMSGTPIFDNEGKFRGSYVTVIDLSEYKRMETELVESEGRYKAIFDTAKVGMAIVEEDATISLVNPEFERFTGYSKEEVEGKMSWAKLIHSDDAKRMLDYTKEQRKNQKGVPTEYELRMEVKNRLRDALIVVDLIPGTGKTVISLLDITERKEAEEQVKHSFVELAETVSRVMGSRDPYTASHQQKVAKLARLIGEKMELNEDRLLGLYIGGLLHDIGKASIPTDILSKPGELTEEEFNLVRSHTKQGYSILKDTNFPWPIADMVVHHHERLDGSGYPHGISADAVSLEARILAVCDVVEAMTAHRPYRPAKSKEEAMKEISDGRGTKYDPEVVDIMLEVIGSGEFQSL